MSTSDPIRDKVLDHLTVTLKDIKHHSTCRILEIKDSVDGCDDSVAYINLYCDAIHINRVDTRQDNRRFNQTTLADMDYLAAILSHESIHLALKRLYTRDSFKTFEEYNSAQAQVDQGGFDWTMRLGRPLRHTIPYSVEGR